MKNLLEQDLQPIAPEKEEQLPIDDLDLEEIVNDGEEKGGDYQFTLKVKQQDDEDSNIEPSFTFVLTPKEEEGEEAEDELESIEDISGAIEGAQAPQPSVAVPAAPLPESVQSDLIPIKEQEGTPIMPQGEPVPTTPPAEMAPGATEPPVEGEEPELEEDAGTELSQEDLKGFIEGSEMEVKFKIDDEIDFTLDESIDYLKLYPDTEIFVTVVGDIEEFKGKLDEFLSNKEGATAEAETEDQNVMVANDGDTLDLKNTPQANPATPEVSRESFAIFNLKNKKNLPDGIYLAHLKENKLYGRVDLKLTPNKLVIGKEMFNLENEINIKESREKETIELTLKETETEKLLALLKDKADITVKL